MKYLVITPGYPKDGDVANCAFVHSRIINYKKVLDDISVFSFKRKVKYNKYTYEGINVIEGNETELEKILLKNEYDKILIHFADRKNMNIILKNRKKAKLLIWVHGVEALGWYRRLFLLDIRHIKAYIKYIINNTLQLKMMRNLIINHQDIIKFIFVSEWMKNVLEHDTATKGKIKNYAIIPNVIDEEIFKYNKKDDIQRFNILSIRSFETKKYANDIIVKSILELSKKNNFDRYNFSIYGKGKLFKKTVKPLLQFKNVKIEERFLNKNEIVEEHKKNGIFLAPTRQDAQGVSMCEAMSSGLVPVTSKNTAIPEFVKDKEDGYLTNNYKELAQSIEKLGDNKKIFLEMSKNSSSHIKEKCGRNVVIAKELELIMN